MSICTIKSSANPCEKLLDLRGRTETSRPTFLKMKEVTRETNEGANLQPCFIPVAERNEPLELPYLTT